MIKISIVTTMYRSANYLVEFKSRMSKTLEKMDVLYEIIMVNDGSPDNSLEVALALRNDDSNVKVIDLSRNFGHHKAILTGLSHTSGDLIFLLDCDLEEEPENLQLFFNEWQQGNGKYDVIYGVQLEREGTYFRKVAGQVFYNLFNMISDEKIPQNPCTIRLMTRRYVDSLLRLNDKNVFLAAMYERVGYNQKAIQIKKSYKGTSSYNLLRKLALMMDGITSFSSKPLSMIMVCGFSISFISILYIVYLIVRKLLYQSIIDGWTSLMVSIWFLSGLIIFSIGIVGVYISKIFNETKDRPISIIRKIYED